MGSGCVRVFRLALETTRTPLYSATPSVILAAVLVLTRCSEDTARCRLPALTFARPRRRSRILEALLTLPYAESRAALHSVCSLPPSPLLEAARHPLASRVLEAALRTPGEGAAQARVPRSCTESGTRA